MTRMPEKPSNPTARVGPTIYSLPPEILSSIFLIARALAEHEKADADVISEGPTLVPLELIVSQVCGLFRRIALTTQRLWTTVEVDVSTSLDLVRLRTWYSGEQTLDLTIFTTYATPIQFTPAGTALLDHLLLLSHRWGSLTIWSDRERRDDGSLVHILSNAPTPRLRSLSIMVDDVEEADTSSINSAEPHVFVDGPQDLQFVRLRGMSLYFFRPRLDTVTVLHIEQTCHITLQYTTFKSMLTASPGLAHLSVYGDIVPPPMWPGRVGDIELPSLLSLRICSIGGDTYSRLLICIAAPMLRSLTLKDLKEHDLDFFCDFANTAHFASLKELVFCDFDLSPRTYDNLFRVFQQLETFQTLLSPICRSNVVPVLMATVTACEAVLPKLQTLSFPFHSCQDDEAVMKVLLKARERVGSPVAKVLMRIGYDESGERNANANGGTTVRYVLGIDAWPEQGSYDDFEDRLFYN